MGLFLSVGAAEAGEVLLKLNSIGILYFTRTALPSCTPGIHFGDPFNTRTASSSVPLPKLRITVMSFSVPSFSTIKDKNTLPSTLFLTASAGYLTLLLKYS
ncbi:hypothetical protein D3C87_1626270 [compost metagenome]